jgi:hypothetical protein
MKTHRGGSEFICPRAGAAIVVKELRPPQTAIRNISWRISAR